MNVYTVTITDNNGCIINTVVPITQPTLLTASISSDTSICSGTNATDNIFASGGTPGYNYLWTSVGSTSSNVTLAPSVTTTYTAQVTDANGCTHSASTKVIVIPTPAALFQSSLDTCSHCLQLADKSTNAISWHWNFGDNDTSNQQNPNHCFATEGVYNVTLTVNSSPQCKNTLSFSDSVFGYKLNPIVPNVFSPNGDGINDVFKISGLDKCSSYSIKIYNRWGIPIYETEKTDFSWDGKTSAGTNAEDGTYYYILTNKTTTRKGFVTLLR
jgi:gliding motility-associated-like protein